MYCIETPDDAWRTEKEKWELHVEMMEYIVAAHILDGVVHSIGDHFEGVALWMPPGCNADSYSTLFKSGTWRLHYKLSKEGKKRYFEEFMTVLHDTKHDVLKENDDNSWYLVYIGVVPEAQGRGLASQLVNHVAKKCDQDKVSMYLESSKERNNRLYQKLGFKLKTTIQMTRSETPVPLYIMVRDAQPILPPPAAAAPEKPTGRRSSCARPGRLSISLTITDAMPQLAKKVHKSQLHQYKPNIFCESA
jgi:ribosomal protein S18 acetylase RimI-like enzyme